MKKIKNEAKGRKIHVKGILIGEETRKVRIEHKALRKFVYWIYHQNLLFGYSYIPCIQVFCLRTVLEKKILLN